MFVVIEGIDGVGKTALCNRLKIHFEEHHEDWEVECLYEPGCTPLAEDIRRIVLAKREQQVSPMAEALLMYAARVDFIENALMKALAKADVILCDRYELSTITYQVTAQGLDRSLFKRLSDLICSDYRPDLEVILDPDSIPKTDSDRIESRGALYMHTVKAAYFTNAGKYAQRSMIVHPKQNEQGHYVLSDSDFQAIVERIEAGVSRERN